MSLPDTQKEGETVVNEPPRLPKEGETVVNSLPGTLRRSYEQGSNSLPGTPRRLFPFHCWWYTPPPYSIPVSLLVVYSLLLLYSRFTVGRQFLPLPFPFHCWTRKTHPCAQVLSVAGLQPFHRFTVGLSFPFHCWA